MSIYQPGPVKKPVRKDPTPTATRTAPGAAKPPGAGKGTATSTVRPGPAATPTPRGRVNNSFTLAAPTATAAPFYGRGTGFGPRATAEPPVQMFIPPGVRSYDPYATATSSVPDAEMPYWMDNHINRDPGLRFSGSSPSSGARFNPNLLPDGGYTDATPEFRSRENSAGQTGAGQTGGSLSGLALLEAQMAQSQAREAAAAAAAAERARAAATAGVVIPPAGPPPAVAPPFMPNPNISGDGGDTSNLQSDFEKLAMLMQIGKFAPEPPAVDNSFRDQMMTMWQQSQAKLEALTADFQSMILQFLKQAQAQAAGAGVPLPAAPAGATGNAFPLSNIPAIANTGSNLQLSNAGLGYLNDINPALNRILQQMLAAKKYTDTGQAGQYGPLNYARFGGSGSLSMTDADYENPLNYVGVNAADRESSEAALRMLFSKMGLNA